MTAECIIENIKLINQDTNKAILTFEEMVNIVLDFISSCNSNLNILTQRIVNINKQLENLICDYSDSDKVIVQSKDVIESIHRLILIIEIKPILNKGCRTALDSLIEAIEDFEENINDFKFRHDVESQEKLSNLLNGFSIAV